MFFSLKSLVFTYLIICSTILPLLSCLPLFFSQDVLICWQTKQNIEQTIKFASFFLKIYATSIKLRASLADLQKKMCGFTSHLFTKTFLGK